MPLSRLIYVSEPQLDPSAGSTFAQLSAILSASRRNNEAADITGALAYDASWFLQILEGERRAVWETFARISEDDRHAGCVLIEMKEVATRLFGNWWMGLAIRDDTTQALFAPYLVNNCLRADAMSSQDVVALMTALASRGLDRKLLAAA